MRTDPVRRNTAHFGWNLHLIEIGLSQVKYAFFKLTARLLFVSIELPFESHLGPPDPESRPRDAYTG
jgi:hypothetical protein